MEVGWRRVQGQVALTPFASLEVDHDWQGAFSETPSASGGGLALHYDGAPQTSVPLTLGGRVASAFPVWGGHVLNVSGEFGWMHEFNPQPSVTASFVAAPGTPFEVLGVSASRDAALTGVDAKRPLTRDVALLGSFTGSFSGVETAVGGFGGLQVTWRVLRCAARFQGLLAAPSTCWVLHTAPPAATLDTRIVMQQRRRH